MPHDQEQEHIGQATRIDTTGGSMKAINSDPGNPLFAFYKNYARFACVTHAFTPKSKEFWVCLDSPNGVLGYFKYKTPKALSDGFVTGTFLGYAQLLEVNPASFSVPDSEDVYRLFLCPRQGDF